MLWRLVEKDSKISVTEIGEAGGVSKFWWAIVSPLEVMEPLSSEWLSKFESARRAFLVIFVYYNNFSVFLLFFSFVVVKPTMYITVGSTLFLISNLFSF